VSHRHWCPQCRALHACDARWIPRRLCCWPDRLCKPCFDWTYPVNGPVRLQLRPSVAPPEGGKA
jgi:hypothetical protein